jgi:polar amino acid transport system substrate-binding protein
VAGLGLAVVSGCSAPADPGIPTAPPVVQVPVNPELADRVPEPLKTRGTLQVGTDPSYRPMEYRDSADRLTGLEIQLVLAVAQALGLEASFSDDAFSALQDGVAAGRYDLGAGALTLAPGESFATDAVLYLATGVQLARGTGSDLQFSDLCGARVAALEGSTQLQVLGDLSRACSAKGGPPITILAGLTQTQVTRRVLTGRADGMVADAPVAQAEVKTYPTELELAEGVRDRSAFALLTGPADGEGFAELVADAIDDLIASGAYHRILLAFGVTQGGLENAVVLPAGAPMFEPSTDAAPGQGSG